MRQVNLPLGIPTVLPDPNRRIEIVCHRGANEYAPENTFASAQICIDWGMDYIEIDVNTSKDGIFYLFHGPSVEKTTNGSGLFHELTSAEIDRLDAGGWFSKEYIGSGVPQLSPFLDWVNGRAKIFFDVKQADHQPLIDLIYDKGLQDDCFFWSGDKDWMQQLHELAPRLAIKANVSTLEDVAAVQRRFQAAIVEVSLGNVTPALLEACRQRQMKVMVYQKENDLTAFQQVLDWGVEMINLNHGDVFADVARDWYQTEGNS